MSDDDFVRLPIIDRRGAVKDYFLVSKIDEERVKQYRWRFNAGGYLMSHQENSLGRFILEMESKNGMYADHISGDRKDNRRCNLRVANPSLNGHNKKDVTSISGYIGVVAVKGKFKAIVKNKHYGTFNTAEEAAIVYNHYANIVWEGKANLNDLTVPDGYIIPTVKRRPRKNTKGFIVKLLHRWKVEHNFLGKKLTLGYYETEALALARIALLNLVHEAKKYWSKYHQELTRNQDREAVIVMNTKSLIVNVLVDDDRWHELNQMKWYVNNNGYATNGREQMHRYLWGYIEPGKVIDHISRNPLDNRMANLRQVSDSVNGQNKDMPYKSNFYPRGVTNTSNSKKNPYKCEIRCEDVRYHLGTHPNVTDAAKAYDRAALFFYGKHAFTNFSKSEYDIVAIMSQGNPRCTFAKRDLHKG